MWREYNENPDGARVGDCVVRAIATATDTSWEIVYMGIVLRGLKLHDMPSGNHVWGEYLKSKGFRKGIIPDTCPSCYTVKDFCRDHPNGRFVLATGTHVIAVIDGDYYDTWDSGTEIPIYYWRSVR